MLACQKEFNCYAGKRLCTTTACDDYFLVESAEVPVPAAPVVPAEAESAPVVPIAPVVPAAEAESPVVVVAGADIVVESEPVVVALSPVAPVLPLLSQATNTPAIARIPRNFFMCL
jgi:hypothetical protein